MKRRIRGSGTPCAPDTPWFRKRAPTATARPGPPATRVCGCRATIAFWWRARVLPRKGVRALCASSGPIVGLQLWWPIISSAMCSGLQQCAFPHMCEQVRAAGGCTLPWHCWHCEFRRKPVMCTRTRCRLQPTPPAMPPPGTCVLKPLRRATKFILCPLVTPSHEAAVYQRSPATLGRGSCPWSVMFQHGWSCGPPFMRGTIEMLLRRGQPAGKRGDRAGTGRPWATSSSLCMQASHTAISASLG